MESTKSEQVNELATALAKAQSEMKGAIKDAQNPFFKSKYADLASVREACQSALSSHNIAVVQTTGFTDHGGVYLVTTLMHASGQWISGALPIKPVKDDPQAMGSAISYARRYALAAITGVAPEDDDGEQAMHRTRPDSPKQAMPNPPPRANGRFAATPQKSS